MSTAIYVREYLAEANPEAVIFEDLDDAILGIASRINMEPVAAYDVRKIIDIYMKRDGMTEEEAIEFFDFNIEGGYYGEGTPIFIHSDGY